MSFFLKITWITGLRDRVFQGVFLLGILLVMGAYLASMFSPRQPQTVALDVGLSGIKIILTFMSLFWVHDQIGRDFDKKTILLSMAFPVKRSSYILGKFLGLSALIAASAMILALLLWIVVMFSERGYEASRPVVLGGGYWFTITGIYFDILVVMAFTLCMATLATISTMPFFLGVIFAVVSRSLGEVTSFIFQRGGDGSEAVVERFGNAIRFVNWILPDLSKLDWREWPMYGMTYDVTYFVGAVAMAVGYMVILVVLSIGIFERRDFV